MQRLIFALIEATSSGRIGERHAARAGVFEFAGDTQSAFVSVGADLVTTRETCGRRPAPPAIEKLAAVKGRLGLFAEPMRDEGTPARIVHPQRQVAEPAFGGGLFGAGDELVGKVKLKRPDGLAPRGERAGSVSEDEQPRDLRLGTEGYGWFFEPELNDLGFLQLKLDAEFAD